MVVRWLVSLVCVGNGFPSVASPPKPFTDIILYWTHFIRRMFISISCVALGQTCLLCKKYDFALHCWSQHYSRICLCCTSCSIFPSRVYLLPPLPLPVLCIAPSLPAWFDPKPLHFDQRVNVDLAEIKDQLRATARLWITPRMEMDGGGWRWMELDQCNVWVLKNLLPCLTTGG